MIQNISPLAQATLGTLFTWALTAAGAALVVVFHGTQRKLLDSSLGFAAGVMIAASYWSLLVPAIKTAEELHSYGENGEYVFFPVTVGFLAGGLFVYLTDLMISKFSLCAPHLLLAMEMDVKRQIKKTGNTNRNGQPQPSHTGVSLQDFYDSSYSRRRTVGPENRLSDTNFLPGEQKLRPYTVFSSSDPTSLNYYESNNAGVNDIPGARTRNLLLKNYLKSPGDQRPYATMTNPQNIYEISSMERDDNCSNHSTGNESKDSKSSSSDQWKRIVLLIIAITVHNIPEGLAVGVRFGAGESDHVSFQNARNLAIGIGIQNFPEGLAVSLPLRASGFSLWKSFWYGQLSGMVEPIFGVLGAVTVSLAKPLLPFALAFAAGAMIYVVVDDIIPEANSCDNGKLATWGTILGFIVMMILEVGLGD